MKVSSWIVKMRLDVVQRLDVHNIKVWGTEYVYTLLFYANNEEFWWFSAVYKDLNEVLNKNMVDRLTFDGLYDFSNKRSKYLADVGKLMYCICCVH